MSEPRRARTLVRSVLGRAIVLAGVWLAASEGGVGYPILAAAAVIATAAISLRVLPPRRGARPRPLAIAAVAVYFLRESVKGGVDVAQRALRPSLPIDPEFPVWQSGLDSPAARTLFGGCLSLLPGTLLTDSEDGTMLLHVLDRELEWREVLGALERRIGAVWGEPSGEARRGGPKEPANR